MTDYTRLLGSPEAPADAYRFATVTQTSPVRIRLDGDTTPIQSAPVVLNAAPALGDRVWVQLHGRQVIVLGVVVAGA